MARSSPALLTVMHNHLCFISVSDFFNFIFSSSVVELEEAVNIVISVLSLRYFTTFCYLSLHFSLSSRVKICGLYFGCKSYRSFDGVC